ncbi:hypothetical protein AMK16_32605 [Streptomyces sp. CB00455]|nr:hypothetical protein AMK16_32605 [Streptomyces sp. CB00455]
MEEASLTMQRLNGAGCIPSAVGGGLPSGRQELSYAAFGGVTGYCQSSQGGGGISSRSKGGSSGGLDPGF